MSHSKSESDKSLLPRPSIQLQVPAGPDDDTSRTAQQEQHDEKLRPTTDRNVMGASPASGAPPTGMATGQTGENAPIDRAPGTSQPSGSQVEAGGPGSEAIGPGPDCTGASGPQGSESVRANPQSGPGGPDLETNRSTGAGEATPRKSYKVDLKSVLEGLMGGPNQDIEVFDDYSGARSFVLEQLQSGIDELEELLEELRGAEDFDDLNLGWHEPPLEEIDGTDE